MSGTVRACVREPSQTANLPFLKKKKILYNSLIFYLQNTSPQKQGRCQSHSCSSYIISRYHCAHWGGNKNGHTCKLTQNLKTLTGRDSQSKNLPDLGLVSRETNQFKKTDVPVLSKLCTLCRLKISPPHFTLFAPLAFLSFVGADLVFKAVGKWGGGRQEAIYCVFAVQDIRP